MERPSELWPGDHFESIKVMAQGKASESLALCLLSCCLGHEAPGKPAVDCPSRTGHCAALRLDRAFRPNTNWGGRGGAMTFAWFGDTR